MERFTRFYNTSFSSSFIVSIKNYLSPLLRQSSFLQINLLFCSRITMEDKYSVRIRAFSLLQKFNANTVKIALEQNLNLCIGTNFQLTHAVVTKFSYKTPSFSYIYTRQDCY
jgi:hypothetical protein